MSSALKAITSFQFAGLTPAVVGSINEVTHTVALTVPYGTPVTALIPTIVVSAAAHVDPHTAVAADFTSPVTYTVTAEDTTTQAYVVTVISSLNLLKQYLMLSADDVSRDTLLMSMWDSAIETIENALGYETALHSVSYQVIGNTFVTLPEPVYSTLVVKYRNDLTDTTGTTDTTLTAWTDYYTYPRHIELRTSRCSDPRIIITYVSGWPTLPAPLENAARMLVAAQMMAVAQQQPGVYINPAKQIPADVAAVLLPYMPFRLPG
jgi:hypothetical protein